MTQANETTETAGDEPAMARTDPRRGRERRPYKIRGPETWALIRESYLAGASARQLAARYDVTEWAIWRRAWKKGWTKQDRVEPVPPPALGTLTPEVDGGAGSVDGPADPGALSREALAGVARAMKQGRLDEARKLSQLAVSLGRLGEGPGRGDFTLSDMVRVIFDAEYRIEVFGIDPDAPPDPVKSQYCDLKIQARDAAAAERVALKTKGYREGRAELRAELGLEPEAVPEPGTEGAEIYWSCGHHVVRVRKR
ncbi:hypothetical protein [Brevundimonas sp.]|uniref:hypothetical protein n=1 Tax=Brevundimonas sp. TaxID=1871086 RepID=UPI0035B3B2DA